MVGRLPFKFFGSDSTRTMLEANNHLAPLFIVSARQSPPFAPSRYLLKATGGFVRDGAFQPPRRHERFNIGFPKMLAVNLTRRRLEFFPRSGSMGGGGQHLFNLCGDLRGDLRDGQAKCAGEFF